MRIEARVELDEHEYAATIECDQATPWSVAMEAAVNAIARCMGSTKMPHES